MAIAATKIPVKSLAQSATRAGAVAPLGFLRNEIDRLFDDFDSVHQAHSPQP
jgi:hypothetical protein